MTESSLIPVDAVTSECKCCFEKTNPADQFCQACGFPLKGSEEEQTAFYNNRNYKHLEIDALKKKISSAATTLYVLSAGSLVYGLIYFFIRRTEDDASAILITYAIVAIIFLLLGAWAAKKPVASLISGLVLYGLLLIMDVINDPINILRGIIFKILIISYLIKGLLSALEAEKIKKQYNI
jgi:ABC-type multidrug transport system permease subunit